MIIDDTATHCSRWTREEACDPESQFASGQRERVQAWQAEQNEAKTTSYDPIKRPLHYNSNPSGIECIDVVEHLNFCRGNAIKYIWRAGLKDDAIQDLEKARWYIEREIARIKKERSHG